ncbi:hypothetical protein HDV03_002984 [Kappamyces sp. JEL0829]|nr:hypothetical protein HDV03_002984 [Kappamyces sp. JEL0829]
MTSKTLVVVCGWMNGSRKTVLKYSQLYKELGLETLVLLSSTSHFLLYPLRWIHTKEAVELRAMLETQQITQIVVHIMSNGGATSWLALESKFPKGYLPVKAMVFDSAPSLFVPERNTRPSPSIFYNHISLAPLRWVASILLPPVLYLSHYYFSFFPHQHRLSRNFHALVHVAKDVPKLFLYSADDKVVRSEDIKSAIESAKSLSTRVSSFDFGNSNHVAHFMRYPAVYRQNIIGFLSAEIGYSVAKQHLG